MQPHLQEVKRTLAYREGDDTFSFGGEPLVLGRQAHLVLARLMQGGRALVSRDALVRAGWPGLRVSDGSLRQAIRELRRALGDKGDTLIESVRGQGYRLRVAVASNEDPSASCGLPCAEIVGREDELAWLRQSLTRALEGAGSSVLVVGPAGVGTSRLLRTLTDAAVRDGWTVLEARAPRQQDTPPLWPLTQMLISHGPAQSLITAEPLVARAVRGVRDANETSPWPIAPAQIRFLLVEAFVRLLVSLARVQPLLVAIDDIDAADSCTLAVLKRFAEVLDEQRILLLVGGRVVVRPGRDRGSLSGAVAALARPGQRLELKPLPTEALSSVFEGELGRALEPHDVLEIHTLTRGNLRESLEVARSWHAGDYRKPKRDLQSVLDDILRERAVALEDSTRELLAVAAAWGEEFELAELVATVDLTPAQVEIRLEEALRADCISEVAPRERYRFSHPRQRQVIRDLHSTPAQQQHLKIARFLEQRALTSTPNRACEIASHAMRSLPGEGAALAVKYGEVAAKQAWARGAFCESVQYYEVVLRALGFDAEASDRERLRLRLAYGEALRAEDSTGTRCLTVFLEVADAAEAIGDAPLLAQAALAYVGPRGQHFTLGGVGADIDSVEIQLIDRALSALDETLVRERSLLLGALSFALLSSPHRVRRLQASDESVQLARTTADASLLARTLHLRVYALWAPPDSEAQLEVCDELVRVTHLNGFMDAEFDARNMRVLSLIRLGRTADASNEISAIAQFGRWFGVSQIGRAAHWAAFHAMATSSGDVAEAAANAAFEESARHAEQRITLLTRCSAIEYHRKGPNAVIRRTLAELSLTYPRSLAVLSLWSCLAAELGDADEARAAFDRAVVPELSEEPRTFTWLVEMAQLAQAASALRDSTRAAIIYERLLPFEEQVVLYGEALVLGPVSGSLAMLATTMGDYQQALHWFDRTLSRCHQLGLVVTEAYARFELARMYALRDDAGDRTQVARGVAQVLESCDALGIPYLAQRTEALQADADKRAPLRIVPSPRT